MFYVVTWAGGCYELTEFSTLREAEQFARECAEQGLDAEVLEQKGFYEAQKVDMAEYNGVTVGVDCPLCM